MTTRRLALALAALLLAACSPAAEKPAEKAGVDVPTPNNPFFGTWTLATSAVAPWWDHMGATPTADPALAKITLAADKTSGPPLLTCDKPLYANNILPQRSLFEGNLPDPATDAPALGFTSPDVVVTTFTCGSGAHDVRLDFPMVDDNTIMLGLDNMLYTFKRAS